MLDLDIDKKFKDVEPGDEVVIDVLVEDMSSGTTKRGTTYLSLKLKDVGETVVPAKVWDAGMWPKGLKVGSICKIQGKASEYQGKLQIVVDSVYESSKKPGDFATKSPINIDVEKMWGELVEIINSFEEPLAKYLGNELLIDEKLVKAIQEAPAAAKVHNNWIGGLLEHAHALCKMAEPIIDHYKRYCPKLSRDKILLCCLIHDLGKIYEFDYSGPKIGYTEFGHLIGHIAWGPVWVSKMVERSTDLQLDRNYGKVKKDLAEIIHIILSHHGKLEYGSPVVPATLEAIIVHNLDMLDTHAMHAVKAMDKEGELPGFSERSYIYGANYKIIR